MAHSQKAKEFATHNAPVYRVWSRLENFHHRADIGESDEAETSTPLLLVVKNAALHKFPVDLEIAAHALRCRFPRQAADEKFRGILSKLEHKLKIPFGAEIVVPPADGGVLRREH